MGWPVWLMRKRETREAVPGRRRWLQRAGAAAACLVLYTGVDDPAPAKRQAQARRVKEIRDRAKPWLDARTACIFPLAGDALPASAGLLRASMLDGYGRSYDLPAGAAIVTAGGGRYPAVAEMKVDLTGAALKPDAKPIKVDQMSPHPQILAAEKFQVVARPLFSHKAQIDMELTGVGVQLDLQHDSDGNPVLMLADAREGTFQLDVKHEDLDRLFFAMAKEEGAKHGVTILKSKVSIKAADIHTLTVDFHLSTLLVIIPAGMRFTAQVHIDDEMNATVSNLTCDGDEALGPLVVNLIRPFLAKFNGQKRPVIGFPAGLRLRDVQIYTADSFHVTATYGS